VAYERVNPDDAACPLPAADQHRARYHLAARFVPHGARIIDAACGYGYGTAILAQTHRARWVLGVDKDPEVIAWAQARWGRGAVRFEVADLDSWELPECEYVVSIETVEHLVDPERFMVGQVRRASRSFFISAPWVPTVAYNPYHRTDITDEHRMRWIQGWRLMHWEYQEGGRTLMMAADRR